MDENHFKIIIRNLIHNALKFTPHGGQVHIKFEEDNTGLKIKISDSGVGMNSDLVRDIMDKKLIRSTWGTQGEKGTGLGLSLSIELLEKNNGKIEIDSQLLKGTTFIVHLPQENQILI